MPQPSLSLEAAVGGALFRDAPFGMAVVDSESGELRRVNDAYCRILGRERRFVDGASWAYFTHPDDVTDDISCVRALYERPNAGVLRIKRYIRPGGSVEPVKITLLRLDSEDGRRYHLSIVESRREALALATERRERLLGTFRMQESFFPAMATLSEIRNRETGEHLLKTRAYVRLLLENLPFSNPFSKKAIMLISNSAMLHDIGKIGIPDSILLKPARLTDDEYDIMKTHTILGKKAICETRRLTGNNTAFIFAQEIAEFHHERWDGTGYPHCLRDHEIPLSARVMAIADVYDALRSERSYKKPYAHDEAIGIILDGAGTHFDPELARAFAVREREVLRISETETGKLNLAEGSPSPFGPGPLPFTD
jgi:PAS domain S-box-containing protein